jgi:hypothetical protein
MLSSTSGEPNETANPSRASPEPYTAMQMAKVVRKIRDSAGLPSTFALDACRQGGMTELEEATHRRPRASAVGSSQQGL